VKRALVAALVAGSLIVLAAIAVFSANAGPAAALDISGNWDLEIGGLGPGINCTATVAQNNDQFSMDLVCPIVGSGSVAGAIDLQTGAFSGTGDIIGFSLSVSGVGTPDSLSGSWSVDLGGGVGASGTFTGTRIEPTPTPTPTRTPAGKPPVNVSGPWNFTLTGDVNFVCPFVVQPSGNSLSAVSNCLGLVTDQFSGIIYETGEFSLSSMFFSFNGTVSSDGTTLSGSWNVFDLEHGAFTAVRAADLQLIDFSGDWTLATQGSIPDTCILHIDQTLLTATATSTCGTLPSGDLVGTADPLAGRLNLVAGKDATAFTLSGPSQADSSYLQGSWQMADEGGTFIAVPADAAGAGVIAIDCDGARSGIQSRCSPLIGDSLEVQVALVIPPIGGYTVFDGELGWTPRPVRFSALDGILPTCALPPPTFDPIAPPLTLHCLSVDHASSAPGPAVQVRLRCVESGDLDLHLTSVAFHEGATGSIAPTIVGSTIYCSRALRGGLASVTGDANCDDLVNSLDAGIVLQVAVALSTSFECIASGDVDADGTVNSIDASLILQYTAGLIPRLPVL